MLTVIVSGGQDFDKCLLSPLYFCVLNFLQNIGTIFINMYCNMYFLKRSITGCFKILEITANCPYFQWIILDMLHLSSPISFADFKLQQRK